LSAIKGFGGLSDVGGGVKTCKLFEKLAASPDNSASTEIAPRIGPKRKIPLFTT